MWVFIFFYIVISPQTGQCIKGQQAVATVSNYYAIPAGNVAAMMAALVNHGPLSVYFNANNNFINYK